jgi:hypothetical protein
MTRESSLTQSAHKYGSLREKIAAEKPERKARYAEFEAPYATPMPLAWPLARKLSETDDCRLAIRPLSGIMSISARPHWYAVRGG